ncbi:hypothetical protein EMIT0180MI3_10234 [Priestia megaterium]
MSNHRVYETAKRNGVKVTIYEKQDVKNRGFTYYWYGFTAICTCRV